MDSLRKCKSCKIRQINFLQSVKFVKLMFLAGNSRPVCFWVLMEGLRNCKSWLDMVFCYLNCSDLLWEKIIVHWVSRVHLNTQKSVWMIWQHFSCLLDEGIPKIWKKLNSHGGFLRADQGRAEMCCQMGWIGSAILQVAQKAIARIQFLSYFWNPLIK